MDWDHAPITGLGKLPKKNLLQCIIGFLQKEFCEGKHDADVRKSGVKIVCFTLKHNQYIFP